VISLFSNSVSKTMLCEFLPTEASL
jgi:hypothetical protein